MPYRRLLVAVALLSILALPTTGRAQQPDPADVESLDAIVEALYEVISGPVGQPRDWERMRSLFLPGARLIPSGLNAQGEHGHHVHTVDQYIETVGPRLEEVGFSEHEIARETDRYGGIAQLFSTYEGRTAERPDQAIRGINSIQAMHDGERWWIVSIFWEAERPDNPIPAHYLP